MNALTLYQLMMYTCDESDLGGVRSYSLSDAKGLVAEARAKKAAETGKPASRPKPEPEPARVIPMPDAGREKKKAGIAAGNGTPLGRAFRKFLGGS